MVYYIKLYFSTLMVFFAVDMVWLGLIARNFYQQHLVHLLAPQTLWLPAVIFYLMFIFGILVFVVVPGLRTQSLKNTLRHGALFGLITYATYDLTNLATLKGWPITLTLVDMAWGMVLSTTVAFASYMIGQSISRSR